jgi:hypothetical protein
MEAPHVKPEHLPCHEEAPHVKPEHMPCHEEVPHVKPEHMPCHVVAPHVKTHQKNDGSRLNPVKSSIYDGDKRAANSAEVNG